jgi:hypothetical protein
MAFLDFVYGCARQDDQRGRGSDEIELARNHSVSAQFAGAR